MTTPNLNLPEIAAAQSQKHVTHNEALMLLDALVQLAVVSRRQAAAPSSPVEGVRYIVPDGATGGFAGQSGKVAAFIGGAWAFFASQAGWRAYVTDEGGFAHFDGTAWRGADFGLVSSGFYGAQSRIATVEAEAVLSGASVVTSAVIPNRAIVFGVSSRTVETVTGAWGYHVGIAGEPEKFGGYLGSAAGSSNAGVIGPQAFYADTPIVITAQGPDFTGGKVRLALHYFLAGVPEM